MELTGLKIFFDDSLLSAYEIAYPLLRKCNVPKILSIVCYGVDGGVSTWRPIGKPVMTLDQVKEMMSNGWEIASHTFTHRYLTELTWDEVILEVVGSKQWIENNLGITPRWFVPPFGGKFTTQPIHDLVLQNYEFGRLGCEYRDSIFHDIVEEGIEKELFYKLLKELDGK